MKLSVANSFSCLFLALALAFCFNTFATAARCESYSGTICAPLYGDGETMIYLGNDTQTQQQIEQDMRQFFGVFGSVSRDGCAAYILASLCAKHLPTCYYDEDDNPQKRYPTQDFCPDTSKIKADTDTVSYTRDTIVPPVCMEHNGSDKNNEYFFYRDSSHDKTVLHTSANYTMRPLCYDWDAATFARREAAEASGTLESFVQAESLLSSNIYTPADWSFLQSAQIQADPRYSAFPEMLAAQKIEVYYPSSNAQYTVEIPTHTCPSLLTAMNPHEYRPSQSPCAIPCPNLTFTHKQYQQEDIFIIVFNSLSLVALFILLLSWVVFPALRLQSYVFYYILCISAMTLALFVLIPIASAQNTTIAKSLCESPTQEYHMGGYAIFQAIVVCFCYLSATAWGLIMVLDIFIQVVIGKHFQKQSREHIIKERLYHAFAWFCGAYSVIGGLASEQMGSLVSVGGAYALITPSRQQQNDGIFNAGDPFFYYPLLILTIISVGLMFAVLHRLIRFKMQAKTTGLKLATFVRLCLFIFANTFIIVVLLIYTVYITGKRAQLNQLTNQFVQCLHLKNTFPFSDFECGDAPAHGLNFDVLLLSVSLFNGMGFIAFLIYGTTLDLVYSWLGLLYVIFGFHGLKRFEKDYKRNRKSTKATTKTHSTAPGGSKTSRSGGSGFSTTAGFHDSQTGPTSRHRPDHEDDHHRSKHNTQISGTGKNHEASQQTKSVFAYHNQHRKGTITHRNPVTSTNTSVEMHNY